MQLTTRKIVLVALTVALTTGGAFLKIPVGPVPITLQTFFVLLSGAILGPGLGAMAMTAYLILGLAGLPVFAGGGGPQYIFSPTFGFLASFPFAAAIVGIIIPPTIRRVSFARALAALLAGTAVVYSAGLPFLAFYLNVLQGKHIGAGGIIAMGMVPFLPGDLLKICIGAFLIPPLRRSLSTLPGAFR